MAEEADFLQYKEHLLRMVNAINREISLTESNRVLIVYSLNTTEKIRKFFDWIGENLKDEKLHATEAEIVRAAVRAGKE
jgi:hypothetical protein